MINRILKDLKEFRDKHWDRCLKRDKAYEKYISMYDKKEVKDENIKR